MDMGHFDIREDVMITVAIVCATPAVLFSMAIEPGMILKWPIALLTASACGFLGLAILMYKRMERVRENRDRWVRICCMYRQGHRDRIARGEFKVAANYMAAMDKMDADTRRNADHYEKWKDGQKNEKRCEKNRQDIADAMPE